MPHEARRRGRRVTPRPEWTTGWRVRAMQKVIDARFRGDTRVRVIEIGDLELVATNY